MTASAKSTVAPLRRDAQRNVERIVAAAAKVFGERGLEASHEAIAAEADVSVGTVYRRFPDKEQLIDTVFEQQVDAIASVAEEALAEEDAWAGLVHMIERSVELSAANRGLRQILNGSPHGGRRIEGVRQRLDPLITALVDRAREAGAIRPDASPHDLPLIMIMLDPVIEAGSELDPEAWRRYLSLILDALRPEASPRDPLPPPVEVEVLDRMIAAAHGGRRSRKAAAD